MDSRTGKNIRLGRLRHPQSGRYLIVAYSHGVLMGPGPGMSSLAEMRTFATTIDRSRLRRRVVNGSAPGNRKER